MHADYLRGVVENYPVGNRPIFPDLCLQEIFFAHQQNLASKFTRRLDRTLHHYRWGPISAHSIYGDSR